MTDKRKQLIFTDDAGDAGFKLDKGSSKYFVIACVIFDDNLVAENVSQAIKKFRRKHSLGDNAEFKFSKTKKQLVKDLLREVCEYEFRICAICVDKTKVRSHELRNKPNSFYNYVIKEALSKAANLQDACVRLDGHADRGYRRTAVAYFRKQVNLEIRKIADFKFYDSKKNDLIQLADLIAGTILRTTETDRSDCNDYYEIIKRRVETLSDLD
jgi:hypothetical protein